MALYTHRSQASRTSHNRPSSLTPAYPYRRIGVGVLREGHASAQAHHYAQVQHIVADLEEPRGSQADHRVASERGYAASCIWTTENSPSASVGEYRPREWPERRNPGLGSIGPGRARPTVLRGFPSRKMRAHASPRTWRYPNRVSRPSTERREMDEREMR